MCCSCLNLNFSRKDILSKKILPNFGRNSRNLVISEGGRNFYDTEIKNPGWDWLVNLSWTWPTHASWLLARYPLHSLVATLGDFARSPRPSRSVGHAHDARRWFASLSMAKPCVHPLPASMPTACRRAAAGQLKALFTWIYFSWF
jgi:hypothetical protein